MPPRVAPRARASPPPKKHKTKATPVPAEPTIPLAYSAAREVYSIAELRQRILGFLGKYDMKMCLRVGEEMLCDVVKVIYRSIDYKRVEAIQTVPSARQRIYAAAVSEVHTTDDDIPREIFLQAGGTFYRSKRRRPLEKYHARACKSISDTLRTLFPYLRKIYYGRDHGKQSWVLDLQVSTSEGPHANTGAALIGHVYVLNRISLYLSSPPPIAVPIPSRPARGYSISQRFNLVINQGWHRDPVATAFTDTWMAPLRNDPMYGDLYTTLDLAELPVAIDDVTSLIRRQIDLGHKDRLQRIKATFAAAFDTEQLIRFADLAASSLTALFLADQYVAARHQHGIGFGDLGTLVSIIRDRLPHLVELRMAMSGVETAESVCRELLTMDARGRPGKLSELRIFTPFHSIALFNVIRCLAPVCADDVSFCVGNYRDGSEQEMFSEFMSRLPQDRFLHLNTVDFPSLGISQLLEACQLEFRSGGRPRSRVISKATIALHHLRAAGADNKSAILLNIDTVLLSCQTMADRLETISRKATTPGFIGEAEDLIDAIKEAQGEIRRARVRLNDFEERISPVVESVAALIRAHKAMEAGGH